MMLHDLLYRGNFLIEDDLALTKLSSLSKFDCTVKLGYKNMLNRGNSGYRGHFAADQFFT